MAVLGAVALGSLAACGGDDDGGSAGTATVPSGQVLRVTAREYKFDPKSIVVTGGGRLRVSLANRGKLAHNLRVMEGDRNVGGTNTFQGGRTQTAEVELAPGRYRFICTVGSHEELGMEGTLEVR